MRQMVVLLSLLLGLSACGEEPRHIEGNGLGSGILGDAGALGVSGRPAEVISTSLGGPAQQGMPSYIHYGDTTGSIRSPSQSPVDIDPGGSKVSLAFVNANIQDFIRSVFDEILKETVIVDPNVAGNVTVRTGEPVDRSVAIEIVRQMLDMNGASLTKEGAVWRISAKAGGPGRPIGEARVVTLHNIGATAAKDALQALSNGVVTATPLPDGRSIVLSGAPQEVEPLIDLVASLDVDRMRGQSFALLPLHEASAGDVAKDLSQVFGAASRNVQLIPVPRMNALLVITSNAAQIRQARAWAARLDHSDKDGRRIFVYPVQNRRAADLADVLRQIIDSGSNDANSAPAKPSGSSAVSPTFQAQTIGSADAAPASTGGSTEGNPQALLEAAFQDSAEQHAPPPPAIRADVATNAIVVVSTPEQYRTISAAIARLDVQPTEVLIEATIAEVTLNNTLRHGVRWFFQTGNNSFDLTDDKGGAVDPTYPGGNYTFSVPSARVVLNALEQVTDVEIVSSPALTVLDNQTATLKVGDQVPIATRSAQSVDTPGAPIVNDIEMKDTGVILSVTPRVNASGLVQLDISQEVSDVVATTTSNLDSPTISQRKIDSTVAVASGSEIVLGGLIGTKREKDNQGLPILKDIPLIGNAFKSSAENDKDRTELLIILRPTVMGSRNDVEAVTQDIKAHLAGAASALYH